MSVDEEPHRNPEEHQIADPEGEERPVEPALASTADRIADRVPGADRRPARPCRPRRGTSMHVGVDGKPSVHANGLAGGAMTALRFIHLYESSANRSPSVRGPL